MIKQLLIFISLASPFFIIAPSIAIPKISNYTISQVSPTEAEIREACVNKRLDALPSPYSDVPKEHWAYSAVASLYYCKSSPLIATAPTSKLQSAPTVITIDGRDYTINAYVWRDFMPTIGTAKKGLMANVNLVAKDGNAIPTTLTMNKLWVIKDNKNTWETTPNNARGGPQWETGSVVDVVVQLVDGKGQTYLLRKPSQRIEATY